MDEGPHDAREWQCVHERTANSNGRTSRGHLAAMDGDTSTWPCAVVQHEGLHYAHNRKRPVRARASGCTEPRHRSGKDLRSSRQSQPRPSRGTIRIRRTDELGDTPGHARRKPASLLPSTSSIAKHRLSIPHGPIQAFPILASRKSPLAPPFSPSV